MIGKSFAGDTLDSAMLMPWVSPPPLSMGTPIGIELQTRRVVYLDPWLLKKLEKITGTIFMVIGQRNAGKTSLLIMIIMRMLLRQAGLALNDDGERVAREMSVRIITRKSNLGDIEYKAMNDYLLGNFVDLNQAGFVNIFDPLMNMTEFDILETAVNVCELANNNVPLTGLEPLVLQVGTYRMLTQYSKISAPEILEVAVRGLEMEDIDAYFASSNSQVLARFDDKLADFPELKDQLKLEMSRPHDISKDEVYAAKAHVSQQLGRMLRLDFGQVFGGTNSLRDVLTDRVTTFNMTGLNMKARTLFESMLMKWDTIAILRNDQEMKPGLMVGDEEHEGVNSPMYMRYKAQKVAKARGEIAADFISTQYVQQLLQAGSEGSEIRGLAKQVSMGIGGYFIGGQPDDQTALDDVASLGIQPHDVMFTKSLKVGQFGLKLPNIPIVWFQAFLTPTELELAKSNQAAASMLEFMPVMEMADIQKRALETGFIQLGIGDMRGVKQ